MYSKESEEYIENGFYSISGRKFYSIWSFKRKNNLLNNSNSQNFRDAEEIGNLYYYSIPDFGDYDKIKIFPEDTLIQFFNI